MTSAPSFSVKSRACFPQQKQGNFIVPALQPQKQRLVAKCKLVANLWQKASRHRSFGENQNGGQATAATPYLNPLWWPVFERGFHAERRSLLTGAAMWGSSSTASVQAMRALFALHNATKSVVQKILVMLLFYADLVVLPPSNVFSRTDAALSLGS
eukprot:symbB.v1.2.028686.t1/scaffold3057.1/size64513/4